MEVYERVLLVKSEVFMFRIPPLGVTTGHKASEWNLAAPDWTGRLRLVSIGDKLEIRLEDKNTGLLYAKAPIEEPNGVDFEAVSDSSRYFVVRLRNDNGQTAFVGIGFGDRGDSFDLNVAVQDHFKSVKRDNELVKGGRDAQTGPRLQGGADDHRQHWGPEEVGRQWSEAGGVVERRGPDALPAAAALLRLAGSPHAAIIERRTENS
ncbi:DUF1681 domain-containing protein [Aphelenchoides fujianensis]|nr:DUF1681 domain-containing protein [Aphelenchoides fujianensis]